MSRKKIPLIYEIVVKDMINRTLKPMHGDKPSMEIADFRRLLAIIYHIPKELHYAIMREFERYGAIRIDHTRVKILRTNGELK